MLSIFSSGYHSRKVFEDKLDALDGYMKSERLPASIRERVKKQFRYQHANRKFYNKEEVLQAITPSHLREIREFKAMQLTEKVPMLADPENKAFAQALAPHLEQKVFYEGDVIFEERTTADAMYFISSGVIELYVPSSYRNDNYHVIGDGCVSAVCLSACRLHISHPSHRFCFDFFSSLEKSLSCKASSAQPRQKRRHSASFFASARTNYCRCFVTFPVPQSC